MERHQMVNILNSGSSYHFVKWEKKKLLINCLLFSVVHIEMRKNGKTWDLFIL